MSVLQWKSTPPGGGLEFIERRLTSSKTLAIIVILAALQSLLYLTPVIDTDGVAYVGIADALAHHFQLQTEHLVFTPGYPLLSLPLIWLTNDPHLGCLLTSFAMNLGCFVIVWHLGRRLFNPVVGSVASILLLFSAFFMRKSFWVMSEPTYEFLLLTSAFFALRAMDHGRILYPALLGLSLSLLHLTRPEGLVVATAVVSLLLLYGVFKRSFQQLSVGLIAGGILVLSYIGYVSYVHKLTGDWVVSTKTYINWYIAHAKYYADKLNMGDSHLYEKVLSTFEDSAGDSTLFERPDLLRFIISEPIYFARHYFAGVGEVVWHLIKGMNIFLVFSGVGLYVAFRNKDIRFKLVLILTLLLPLGIYPVFFIRDRMVETVIPLLCVFAAVGLVSAFYRGAGSPMFNPEPGFSFKKMLSKLAIGLVLVCLVAPLSAVVVKKIWEVTTTTYDPQLMHKAAGLWLKQHSQEGESVMVRKPWVTFYSHRERARIPYDSADVVFEKMKQGGVDYLVIDSQFTRRPQLEFLLQQPELAPPFLHLVYKGGEGEYQIVIFKANYKNTQQRTGQ